MHKSRKIKILLSLLGAFVLACGDVNISPKPEDQLALETKLPEGVICSRPPEISTGLLKVVFVVDMSLSNIGEFKDDLNGKVKFDATHATDPNGTRFDKIAEFISGCGSANASNVFKVVGFSGAAIKANPAMSGCQGGFVSKSQALAATQNLKGLQKYNQQNINTTDFNPSMQTTTYQDGLDCARSVVLDDIQQNPTEAKNANYMVFFVTDGMASDNCPEDSIRGQYRDKYGTCCPGGSIRAAGACCAPGVTALRTIMYNQYCCQVGERTSTDLRCEKDPDYTPVTNNIYNPSYESLIREMMLTGKQKSASVRLQTIYYGSTNEASEAAKTLDQLSRWGDSAGNVMLGGIQQADFCKYAASPVNTQFQISEINVVNLTALMKDGYLRADSDMDGVADIFDSNPTNARSNSAGLLDGICRNSSGNDSCLKPLSCDLKRQTQLHLTECDLAAFGVADSDGMDSDKDRIPDLIEILRGTLPSINDSFNNLDGDSMTNIQEIHVGRQVDSPDDSVAPDLLMNWSISKLDSSDQCPANQQSWKLVLDRIPTVPVKAYQDPMDHDFANSKFQLSHKENENVIFVYYLSEPLNSAETAAEIYGTTIRIPYGAKDLSQIRLQPRNFQKLGSINGRPQ